jgi:hypothetical protein
MPLETEGKVLRTTTSDFQRVGGAKKKVDVRIVSSTSRDLAVLIADGRFREDLYHRLGVVPVQVPALSERREDIPELIEHFPGTIRWPLASLCAAWRPMRSPCCRPAIDRNVRELKNNVERILIVAGGDPASDIAAAALLRAAGGNCRLGDRRRAASRLAARDAREAFGATISPRSCRASAATSRNFRLHRHGTLALHRKIKLLGLPPRARKAARAILHPPELVTPTSLHNWPATRRERQWPKKPQNLQDTFSIMSANRRFRSPFLVNGVKLQGVITWFDNLRPVAPRWHVATGLQARNFHHHAGRTHQPVRRRVERRVSTRKRLQAGSGLDLRREGPAAARAIVLHVERRGRGAAASDRDAHARLEEAVGLARAIDLDIAAAITAPLIQVRPATFIGSGKVEEIARLVEESKAELVCVNAQLSPIQQRNLEKAWNAKVLDRTGLILEIFGRRASTREGILQVELAHLQYQKSRLVRSWTHLERQRGGLASWPPRASWLTAAHSGAFQDRRFPRHENRALHRGRRVFLSPSPRRLHNHVKSTPPIA